MKLVAAVAAGLGLGLLLAILLGGLTPAGVGGTASALASVFASPAGPRLALPYFGAIGLSAAGLAVAYRAGFITIGAEGQLVLGILAAYWVVARSGLAAPPVVMVLLAALAAVVVGAAYSLVVALLRTSFTVNETLSSLMLNYVAYGLYNFIVSGPWRSGGFTRTEPVPAEYMVPAAAAAVAAVAVAAGYEALMRFTRLGVALDSLGLARKAALTYGVSYSRGVAAAALLAGAAAGLAGALYMLSTMPALYSGRALGYGYIGILAAWLAARSPLLTAPASLLLALLYVAATRLQLAGVEASFASAAQAVFVLSTVSLAVYASKRRG